MFRAKFTSTGTGTQRKKFQNLRRGLPDEIANAVYVEIEIETTEAKRRTPVKTGALRSTIHQEGPFREDRRVWSSIVAGGPAAGYAVIVHEDLTAFHKVGQAKYIESVIMESRPSMAARVAKRIDLNRAANR